jgi:hypothetical protein
MIQQNSSNEFEETVSREMAILNSFALMMEAARTSETLVNFYQTTRRYNPEDGHLQLVRGILLLQVNVTTVYSTSKFASTHTLHLFPHPIQRS